MAGMLLAAYGTLAGDDFGLAFQPEDFDQSNIKRLALFQIEHAVRQIAQEYRSEEFITSGGLADPLLNSEDSQPSALRRELEALRSSYDRMINNAQHDLPELNRLTRERDRVLGEKQTQLEQAYRQSREQLIAMDLSVYRSMKARLDEPDTSLYYAPIKGGGTLSNLGAVADVAAFFSELPAFSEFQLADGNTAYGGMTSERYNTLRAEYQSNRQAGIEGFYCFLGGITTFLLGLGYVVNTAGVHSDSKQVALGSLDRVYLDVALVALFGLGASCLSLISVLVRQYQTTAGLVLGAVLTSLFTLSILAAGDMLSKRVKRRELLQYTLIYAVVSRLWCLLIRCLRGISRRLELTGSIWIRLLGLLLVQNVAILLAAYLLMASHSFIQTWLGLALLLGPNALLLLYLLRKVVALRQISDGAERLGAGDFAQPIPLDTNAELAELARRVNQIAAGMQAAVEREVKAERMKTELVTNVSHDLKTPLTSIITYIDLLKTEGLTSKHAARYLEVIEQKSQRLKTLTEDLFEAAKAASGSIALHLERLDVAALVNQSVAELMEKIEASGLDFRITLPPEKVYVQADGKLLWRVLENLLQNILKYALPGSRVYMEVAARDGQVGVILRNISASPLNIDPDELLERFKRGDESRHSEGSGLGLSIAKSLVELQGGTFCIQIDGDLFKTTLALPQRD